MINSEVANKIYTAREGVTEYAIGFPFFFANNGNPEIKVLVGGEEKEYATDWTLSEDKLYIVLAAEVEQDTSIEIRRFEYPFVQDSEYQLGRIDPKQIERDFDKSVIRDQQLAADIKEVDTRLSGRLDEHDTQLEQHDTMLGRHNERISYLETNAEALGTAVNHLTSVTNSHKTTLLEHSATLDGLGMNVEMHDQRIGDLETDVSAIKAHDIVQDSRIVQHTNRLNAHDTQLEQHDTMLGRHNKRISYLETNAEALGTAVNHLTSVTNSHKTTLLEHSATLDGLGMNVEMHDQRIGDLETDVSAIKAHDIVQDSQIVQHTNRLNAHDTALGNLETVKANKADVYTKQAVDEAIARAKVSAVHYKGSVSTFANLPTGAALGDMYNVRDTDANYIWDGSSWDMMGSLVDLAPIEAAVAGKVSKTGDTMSGALTFSDGTHAMRIRQNPGGDVLVIEDNSLAGWSIGKSSIQGSGAGRKVIGGMANPLELVYTKAIATGLNNNLTLPNRAGTIALGEDHYTKDEMDATTNAMNIEIETLHNDLGELGDQVHGIEELIPDSATATNHLATMADLGDNIKYTHDLSIDMSTVETDYRAAMRFNLGHLDDGMYYFFVRNSGDRGTQRWFFRVTLENGALVNDSSRPDCTLYCPYPGKDDSAAYYATFDYGGYPLGYVGFVDGDLIIESNTSYTTQNPGTAYIYSNLNRVSPFLSSDIIKTDGTVIPMKEVAVISSNSPDNQIDVRGANPYSVSLPAIPGFTAWSDNWAGSIYALGVRFQDWTRDNESIESWKWHRPLKASFIARDMNTREISGTYEVELVFHGVGVKYKLYQATGVLENLKPYCTESNDSIVWFKNQLNQQEPLFEAQEVFLWVNAYGADSNSVWGEATWEQHDYGVAIERAEEEGGGTEITIVEFAEDE